ncbi:MAG: hypothetical protein C0190_05260 [Thermodesulfobacterium geofontis]|uniref:DUF86 domain-containing protein n=1 Tax=Thermodesulfobacterium geofontis TaxID=1295609 RepID=A0A2N7PMP9_9BACT|nr:MAG: hypothetical protein C0190_05260 [Thermodesulfobacterium geofontis]
MVISKLNFEKINSRIFYIEESLKNLYEIKKKGKETFLNDPILISAAESNIRRALEAIFDIARHILAKSYGYKDLEYKQMAKLLVKEKVLPESYLSTLIKMAGYRNRLVHFYFEITPEELWEILEKNLSDFKEFLNLLNFFLMRVSSGI